MAGPREITDVLDALVDHGRLVGYVCGVREGGRSRTLSGGARTVGGSALGEDAVTGPLGLAATGPTADFSRLPTSYGLGPDGRGRPLDTAGRFAVPPVFESLAYGLAATVGDYLELSGVLVDGGPLLGAQSARLMTTDHLTARQRASAEGFAEPGCGYGFQVEDRPGGVVGWVRVLGTIGYVDRGTRRPVSATTCRAG